MTHCDGQMAHVRLALTIFHLISKHVFIRAIIICFKKTNKLSHNRSDLQSRESSQLYIKPSSKSLYSKEHYSEYQDSRRYLERIRNESFRSFQKYSSPLRNTTPSQLYLITRQHITSSNHIHSKNLYSKYLHFLRRVKRSKNDFAVAFTKNSFLIQKISTSF